MTRSALYLDPSCRTIEASVKTSTTSDERWSRIGCPGWVSLIARRSSSLWRSTRWMAQIAAPNLSLAESKSTLAICSWVSPRATVHLFTSTARAFENEKPSRDRTRAPLGEIIRAANAWNVYIPRLHGQPDARLCLHKGLQYQHQRWWLWETCSQMVNWGSGWRIVCETRVLPIRWLRSSVRAQNNNDPNLPTQT